MRIKLLGPLEVLVADEQVRLAGPRQRKLVAALALAANRTVSVSRLTEVLWDHDPPPTADKQVRNLAGMVRKAFGTDGHRLVTDPIGYRLLLTDDLLDTDEFDSRAVRARSCAEAGDLAAAVAAARAALALWRGPMLGGLDCPALVATIAGWEERRLVLHEQCLGWELDLGGHEGIVAELRELTLLYPAREQLAEHLMLALYSNGSQSEALRVFQQIRGVLVDELGVEPGPRLREMQRAVLAQEAAPASSVRSWLGSRPHLSVLVGRDIERAEAAALTREGRLVTVLGVGGVGKSSLALAVADDLAADFAGGVVVVSLAEVRHPDQVVPAIGSVLGITATSTGDLVRRLSRRRVLLILDDCEHVADACARVVRHLLSGTEEVRVLTTSRRPLGLPEERVWTLAGLSGVAAAELFGRRAREAVPEISLDPGDIVRVCRRLDGLPLALELAAARLRTVPLTELADRLDDGLDLLSGGRICAESRHRTLAAAIEWSYRLLEPTEQLLLARLSVFAGAFTAEDVEAVCHPPPLDRRRILPTLAALVDHSLVQPTGHSHDHRYRLLEAVRDYAAARLADLDEAKAMIDSYLHSRLNQLHGSGAARTAGGAAQASRPTPRRAGRACP